MTKYGQEKLSVPYLDSYNLCSEGKEATSASFSHTTCHTRPVTLKGVSLWKDKRPHALRTGSSGLVLWPAPRSWVLGYLCRCVIFHLLLETAWSLCWLRPWLDFYLNGDIVARCYSSSGSNQAHWELCRFKLLGSRRNTSAVLNPGGSIWLIKPYFCHFKRWKCEALHWVMSTTQYV